MLGLAAGTARAARPAVDLAFQLAGFLPGSLDPPLVVSVLDRVNGACHVIVAPREPPQSTINRTRARVARPGWRVW